MDALYLAWKLDATDASSVRRAQDRLTSGAERSLYRLRCWSIGNGEARALLSPAAPLEQIAQAIWPVSYTHLDVYKRQGRCRRLARELK